MEDNVLKFRTAIKERNRDTQENIIMKAEGLSVFYDDKQALNSVSVEFRDRTIHSIIGPSGCGKSTLLRSFNLMHTLSPNAKIEGKIELNGENLLEMDPMIVRRRIGMVFQRPNPFPNMSIYENVLAGYRFNNIKLSKSESDDIVEYGLEKAALWEEVKDKLRKRGTFLSGGQQQRLCIARALAMQPDVLLLDEPTSALDPIATSRIEELVTELRESMSVIIVTHNLQQAGRISDYVAFMLMGDLVEYDRVDNMFFNPKSPQTEAYLSGKFG